MRRRRKFASLNKPHVCEKSPKATQMNSVDVYISYRPCGMHGALNQNGL